MRILLLLVLPMPARALHDTGSAAGPGLEALAMGCLALAALFYAAGVRNLWRRAGAHRGVTGADVLRFAAGWGVLVVALLSPLDAWGGRLFWAHMVQHELLMVVAAPLLVASRPLEAWTWAFTARGRARLGAIGRNRVLRKAWDAIADPFGAWLLHAAALWGWHVPALFEAAARDPWLHALQHASFLGTALLFWSSVLPPAAHRRSGAAFASLLTTMMHSGALGALLTFSSAPWYPRYGAGSAGLGGLEDQQLGGLIMWAPASLAYLAAALLIAFRWLSPPPRRTAGSCAASSRPSC